MVLTKAPEMEIIITMATSRTMTDLLREALGEVDNLHQLERETGVQRASMYRFLAGTQSLRLDKADILAAYFGITSTRKRKR